MPGCLSRSLKLQLQSGFGLGAQLQLATAWRQPACRKLGAKASSDGVYAPTVAFARSPAATHNALIPGRPAEQRIKHMPGNRDCYRCRLRLPAAASVARRSHLECEAQPGELHCLRRHAARVKCHLPTLTYGIRHARQFTSQKPSGG